MGELELKVGNKYLRRIGDTVSQEMIIRVIGGEYRMNFVGRGDHQYSAAGASLEELRENLFLPRYTLLSKEYNPDTHPIG